MEKCLLTEGSTWRRLHLQAVPAGDVPGSTFAMVANLCTSSMIYCDDQRPAAATRSFVRLPFSAQLLSTIYFVKIKCY